MITITLPIRNDLRRQDRHNLRAAGSAMTHRPHVHIIVPGGGLSEDGTRWIACRPNFLLAVRVLSRLFRRLVLQRC